MRRAAIFFLRAALATLPAMLFFAWLMNGSSRAWYPGLVVGIVVAAALDWSGRR